MGKCSKIKGEIDGDGEIDREINCTLVEWWKKRVINIILGDGLFDSRPIDGHLNDENDRE
ncbi:unnamed protein product, partial [Dovyalis caffra]